MTFCLQWIAEDEANGSIPGQLNDFQERNPECSLVSMMMMMCPRNPGETQRYKAVWARSTRPEVVEPWPSKEDYLGAVAQVGRMLHAWAALKAHIGNDVVAGSRFERLIWLMDAAAKAEESPSPQLLPVTEKP